VGREHRLGQGARSLFGTLAMKHNPALLIGLAEALSAPDELPGGARLASAADALARATVICARDAAHALPSRCFPRKCWGPFRRVSGDDASGRRVNFRSLKRWSYLCGGAAHRAGRNLPRNLRGEIVQRSGRRDRGRTEGI